MKKLIILAVPYDQPSGANLAPVGFAKARTLGSRAAEGGETWGVPRTARREPLAKDTCEGTSSMKDS